MDVVLVGGVELVIDFVSPQIGPLIIKNIISSKYECEFLDFDYLTVSGKIRSMGTYEENINLYVEYVLKENPKIVGFYTMCNSFDITIRMARKIKERKKDIRIMFGGPQATLNFRECLLYFDFLDVIVLGESEKAILPVIDNLLNNCSLDGLKGIAFKEKNKIKFSGMNELLTNEELYEYVLEDYSPYSIDKKDILSLEGGRGCPYNCTFCSTSIFWGRKYRVINAYNFVDHIEKLRNRYGIEKISIVHDHFTVSSKHVKLFCEELKRRKLNIEWNCSARVNNLDSCILELMKESGCKNIFIGMETGSPRMQRIINKNIDLEQAFQKIIEIKNLGIDMTISLIYGFPDESIEDFFETICYIERLYEYGIYNVQMHYFNIYNKTEEYNKVKDIMYFEKNSIDFSLYEDKTFDSETIHLITEYPCLFSQYYTFDTEVRKKYPLFETLICMISISIHIFENTLLNIIKQKGILNLYKDLEKEIIEIHKKKICENNIRKSIAEKNFELLECMDKYIKDNYVANDIDRVLYRFERSKCDFAKGKEDNKYIIFPYDIQQLIKSRELIPQETAYLLYRMEDNRVKVKRIPTLLKNIVKEIL